MLGAWLPKAKSHITTPHCNHAYRPGSRGSVLYIHYFAEGANNWRCPVVSDLVHASFKDMDMATISDKRRETHSLSLAVASRSKLPPRGRRVRACVRTIHTADACRTSTARSLLSVTTCHSQGPQTRETHRASSTDTKLRTNTTFEVCPLTSRPS